MRGIIELSSDDLAVIIISNMGGGDPPQGKTSKELLAEMPEDIANDARLTAKACIEYFREQTAKIQEVQ